MANGISGWIRRLFKRERPAQWNWNVEGSQFSKDQSLFAPRVTLPQISEPVAPRDRPDGKVVLGFRDGTQVALDESHPLVKDFINAADRMTRPARWKKLFGTKVGL